MRGEYVAVRNGRLNETYAALLADQRANFLEVALEGLVVFWSPFHFREREAEEKGERSLGAGDLVSTLSLLFFREGLEAFAKTIVALVSLLPASLLVSLKLLGIVETADISVTFFGVLPALSPVRLALAAELRLTLQQF